MPNKICYCSKKADIHGSVHHHMDWILSGNFIIHLLLLIWFFSFYFFLEVGYCQTETEKLKVVLFKWVQFLLNFSFSKQWMEMRTIQFKPSYISISWLIKRKFTIYISGYQTAERDPMEGVRPFPYTTNIFFFFLRDFLSWLSKFKG